MDVNTNLKQLSPNTSWLLFAFMVSLSVSLNENTEVLTQFGTVGKIELNFNTSGHVPIVTWTLPQSTTFQHDLQVDNVVKTTKDYNSTVAENGIFAALEIYNVNFLDAGTYTCHMDFSDTGRSSERSIQVSVIDPASIRYAWNDLLHISLHQFANVCCISKGNPRPSVELQWLSTEGDWEILPNVTEYVYHIEPYTYWTFKIHVAVRQPLQVRCFAINKIPPAATTQVLNLVAKYPASVRMLSLSTTVPEGSDITIECQSDGHPPPNTRLVMLSNMNESEWTHLPTKAKMNNKSITTWKFELEGLAMNDTGEYQCVANNSEGYASSKTIEINVTSRVYLSRALLAIVISAVLAFISLVALLIQLLKNRHDRSCLFSSERKSRYRFQKEESNDDNDENERQKSDYYHNYSEGIQLYATTIPTYEFTSCKEDGE
ncbi:neural cell adhesion molecule 1-A-like isoform X2 [Apostichopus japonicus]|uniref:neural cell adhesion molecule 1-A-like isoform X2 n=1 Tax=Stichopus japonicus TaxID=307972 RepID=UPI003AB829C0